MADFCSRCGRTILELSATALLAGFIHTFSAPAQSVTNYPPVNTLIRELIVENGGATNTFPKFTGPEKSIWQVTKDSEGAQVLLTGNQMEALEAMFKATFGAPIYISTNTAGKKMLQYNKTQTGGVGLSCTLSSVKDGSMYTHLLILGPKGLDAISGKSQDPPAPILKSAEEKRACEIAIKTAVDHGIKGDLDAIASGSKSIGWVARVFDKSKGPFADGGATVAITKEWRVVSFEVNANK